LLDLVHALVIAAPWIAGAAFFSWLTSNTGTHVAIKIGAGGYLGYLFLGSTIWATDTMGLQFYAPFSYWWVLVFFSIVTALCSTKIIRSSSLTEFERNLKSLPQFFPLLIWPAAILLFISLSFSAPPAAWDALDHWGLNASRLIQHHSLDVSTYPVPFMIEFRHPWTIVSINSWSIFFSADGALNARGIPHLLMGISLFLLTYGFCRYLSVPTPLSFICGYLSFNPLIENHITLYGYAEIWLAVPTVCSLVLCLIAKAQRSLNLYLLSGAFALSLMSIKNVGYLYCMAMFVFIISVFFSEKTNIYRILGSRRNQILLSVFLILAIAALGIWVGSSTFITTITLDRDYIIEVRSVSEALGNLFSAMVFNQTFNIIASVFLLSCVFFSRTNIFEMQSVTCGLACILGLSLLAVQTVDQIFLYSRPSFDTAFSRLFIPFSQLTPLLVGSAIGNIVSSESKTN